MESPRKAYILTEGMKGLAPMEILQVTGGQSIVWGQENRILKSDQRSIAASSASALGGPCICGKVSP